MLDEGEYSRAPSSPAGWQALDKFEFETGLDGGIHGLGIDGRIAYTDKCKFACERQNINRAGLVNKQDDGLTPAHKSISKSNWAKVISRCPTSPTKLMGCANLKKQATTLLPRLAKRAGGARLKHQIPQHASRIQLHKQD